MDATLFADLERSLGQGGPDAAAENLIAALRERRDYPSLFYAMLLKKRVELGISPLPTGPSTEIPESLQEPYEQAIREAARIVGGLFLDEGKIPQAWPYFRMIGEPRLVADALEKYQPTDDEDMQPLIEIAYHHGAHPRKGFDWILTRYGICNAITTVSGQDPSTPADVRDYCLKRLVHALYNELCERLQGEIAGREGTAPETHSVHELMAGRDWLFDDGFYHIDMSHLASVVQMSIYVEDLKVLLLARELCAYGRRLAPQYQFSGEPPFEDQYNDYDAYLAVLTGDEVEKHLDRFRDKAATADPETVGTRPAEILVNLLLRINRPAEALAVARQYIAGKEHDMMMSPPITELCRQAGDFRALAEVARGQNDPVNYLAGLVAARS